jgi:hypothetical protein
VLPVRLYLLKQFIQLYDFLDLEAVVDNAEEEEELDEEEFGKPIARIYTVSLTSKYRQLSR